LAAHTGLFPLGLPALINILRQNGIDVQGVNHPLERQLNSVIPSRQLAAPDAGQK
jgi:hypothetical protein